MTEIFNEFKRRWLNKAKEIKKQKLEPKFCIEISNHFMDEITIFSLENPLEKLSCLQKEELITDVDSAIMIAYSNYEAYSRKTSWGYRFFSKIKSISMFNFNPKLL